MFTEIFRLIIVVVALAGQPQQPVVETSGDVVIAAVQGETPVETSAELETMTAPETAPLADGAVAIAHCENTSEGLWLELEKACSDAATAAGTYLEIQTHNGPTGPRPVVVAPELHTESQVHTITAVFRDAGVPFREIAAVNWATDRLEPNPATYCFGNLIYNFYRELIQPDLSKVGKVC